MFLCTIAIFCLLICHVYETRRYDKYRWDYNAFLIWSFHWGSSCHMDWTRPAKWQQVFWNGVRLPCRRRRTRKVAQIWADVVTERATSKDIIESLRAALTRYRHVRATASNEHLETAWRHALCTTDQPFRKLWRSGNKIEMSRTTAKTKAARTTPSQTDLGI